MKSIKPLLLIISLLVIVPISGVSQDHFDLMDQGEKNFERIEAAFYRFYERNGRQESDLKKYERWKHRVYPRLINGNIPGSRQELIKAQEFNVQVRQNNALRIESTNQWESLGPDSWQVGPNGYSPGNGRINSITVDPNDPDKLFAGSAGGGLWISENGGSSWYTTTDELPILGVTDIYVNPQNSQEVIVLTGDGMARNTPSIGLIKSTDGGQTWDILGLEHDIEDERTYRKLQVSPTDPNHMLVAGSSGIYLSTNGGVDFVRTVTSSVSDVAMNPANPLVCYATRHSETVNGRVSVFVSTDGGGSWSSEVFDFGLGDRYGRKMLGVSPANPDVVYILATNQDNAFGGLFRSNDQMATLDLQSTNPNILGWSKSGSDSRGQGWYDLALTVDPQNEDVIYTGGVHIWKSSTAGSTWELQNYWVWNDSVYPYVHADVHTLDFYNGKLYAGTDGGLFMSDNDGDTFQNLSFGMEVGQFYRLSVHPTDPDIVSGGLQDNGSFYKGSNGWSHIYGADGMESLIDYSDPTILFSSSQFGNIKRYINEGNIISKHIIRPDPETGAWITPYIMHPTDANIVYFGFNNVWRSSNKGNSMVRISNFGTGDNINVLKQHRLYPEYMLIRRAERIYISRNEGSTWELISDDLQHHFGYTFRDVSFNASDPEVIYATFSNWDDEEKILVSNNGGQDWENMSEGLPLVPVNCLISRNDCDGTLYAGTDIGVYQRKRNDTEWSPMGVGLPNVIVEELEIQKSTNYLFAATYGRGIWRVQMDESEEQFLSVLPIDEKSWGDADFEILASSTLPGEITISSNKPHILDINGTTASIEDVGDVVITVTQVGTCSIDIPMTIDRADQFISFHTQTEFLDTQWDFELHAESTSGLPVQFFSTKPGIIAIDGNLAQIKRAGTVNISAQQSGNQYFKPADGVSFMITIDKDREAQVAIYPNPVFNDVLTLYIPKNQGFSKHVLIYDMRGRKIMEREVDITKEPATFDLSELEQGLYIMKVGEDLRRFMKN